MSSTQRKAPLKATELAALVGYLGTLQERARKAATEYESTSNNYRAAFCDGQAHAWGRAASDLAEILGLDGAEG